MRRVALAIAALVAACVSNRSAPAQPVQATPIHGDTPGHTCRTAGTDKFIGKTATKMIGAAIKDVTRAAVLRWAPPYTMLTMDFRADRVNVYFDSQKTITKINCG
jgi:Peptidase inhibitor I78 family